MRARELRYTPRWVRRGKIFGLTVAGENVLKLLVKMCEMAHAWTVARRWVWGRGGDGFGKVAGDWGGLRCNRTHWQLAAGSSNNRRWLDIAVCPLRPEPPADRRLAVAVVPVTRASRQLKASAEQPSAKQALKTPLFTTPPHTSTPPPLLRPLRLPPHHGRPSSLPAPSPSLPLLPRPLLPD